MMRKSFPEDSQRLTLVASRIERDPVHKGVSGIVGVECGRLAQLSQRVAKAFQPYQR